MESDAAPGLTPREGRRFAFTVGGAFLVLAGLLWWRGHPIARDVLAGMAAVLIGAGAVVPGRLGPVHRGWMGLAHRISRVTTPVVMGIVYFAVLVPVGVIRRGIGGNPIRHRPRSGSFWKDRPPDARKGDLDRQF